jgi:DNA-binding transcriptional MerR regulator
MSSEFKITPRTLRFYEENGLLTPSRQGQSRIYSGSDRVRLELILRGKRLGFSLEESCDIIDMYDPTGNNLDQLEKVTATVRMKIIQLEQQQRDLKRMLSELKTWEDNYLKAIQGLTKVNSGETTIHSRVNP